MKKLFYSTALFFSVQSITYAEINFMGFSGNKEISQEKEYKKITPQEVKKEALMNIKAKYGDYQITEAAVSPDGEYKLTLKKDNGSLIATFTPAGDLIKIY